MGQPTGSVCVQGQLSGGTYRARVCQMSTEWGNLQGQSVSNVNWVGDPPVSVC